MEKLKQGKEQLVEKEQKSVGCEGEKPCSQRSLIKEKEHTNRRSRK